MAKKESKYAWFVVFCSFMLHFITDGVSYTFGIFFSALLNEYHTSNAAQAWVPSIMTGITYGIGPIASILTNKYGCSIIAISGTTLCSLGYLFSTFAPNVITLYFTLGVLAGAGFGLVYLPAIVCITQYFSVRLALATGLAVSASGIGSALFAPLTEYFVQRYGWRIAMQLTSLLLLLSGLFALSFKELSRDDNSLQEVSYVNSKSKVPKQNMNEFNYQNAINSNLINSKEKNQLNEQNLENQINQLKYEKKIILSNKELSNLNNYDSKLRQQHHFKNEFNLHLPSVIENSRLTLEDTNDEHKNFDKRSYNNHYKSHTNLDLNSSQIFFTSQNPQSKSQHNLHHNYNSFSSHHNYNSSLNNLNTIVLYSTSMTSINYCTNQDANNELTISHSSNHTNTKHNSLPSQQLNNVLKTYLPSKKSKDSYLTKLQCKLFLKTKKNEQQMDSLFKKKTLSKVIKLTNFQNYIKVLLSWNLLKDKLFLWFAISNFLTSLGYYVPHIYIKQRCSIIPKTNPSECSYLFSIIGFSSTIGRILFGFLSDFKGFNRLFIYSSCLTLCGLSTVMTIFATNYFFLSIYCVIFGLTTGAFVSLTSVILVDLLGLDRLSNAFGLLLLFQGIASLIGPPIIGWFYDLSSSYNPGFCFIGLATIISGIMLYFIPYLKKSVVINLN